VVTQVFYVDRTLLKQVTDEIERLRRGSGRWWPGLYVGGLPDGF
jgi:hypothetical protein